MPDSIKIGEVFAEHEIVEICAETRMCFVYKGKHEQNFQVAAIKVPQELTNSRELIINEGIVLASLCRIKIHQHIVGFRHQGTQGNRPYLIMEYVSDQNLRKLIDRTPQTPVVELDRVERIVKYAQQAARALQFAHDNNIIHCDIKPENMLLRNNDDIVLCDFGHAVQILPPTDRTQNIREEDRNRTADYMAPEQVQAADPYHCRASDQYALGLVIYELICGKLPKDPISQSIKISRYPKEWNESFTSMNFAFINVLLKALSQKPSERYKTVQEFADALAEAAQLNGQSIPQPQSSPVIPSPANTPATSTGLAQTSNASSPLSSQSNGQPGTNQTKIISRRAFFAVVDVITLGILGFSWTKLVPSVAQALVPPVVTPTPFVTPTLSIQPLGHIDNIYHGHKANVNGVAWSTDGTKIASGSFDHTIQIWDAIDGFYRRTLMGHTERVNDVAWSGNLIASCSGMTHGTDFTVRIWNADNGRIISILDGHRDVVNAVAWSPDGKYVASASFDRTVIVWDISNNSISYIYKKHTSAVYAVAWSPDSKFVASCSTAPENEVHIWEATTGRSTTPPYTGHTDDVLCVSWVSTRKGMFIASGSKDKSVRIWSPDGRDKNSSPRTFNAPISKVAWSPKGQYLAAGSRLGEVYVWNEAKGLDASISLYTEKNQSIFGMPINSLSINALAWSPDGTMIATGGNDSSVQVWSSGLPSGV